MSGSGDEQLPDLSPNATTEEITKRGRDLREAHAEIVRGIGEFEKALAAAIEKVEAEGSTESAAATIAEAQENLAAMKVLAASMGEQNQLGREIAREKGLNI
jgi:hypothetical protein